MGPEDAACAVELLNPKLTIPIHYNTFPPIEQDPEVFKALVKEHEVKIMNAGDALRLLIRDSARHMPLRNRFNANIVVE